MEREGTEKLLTSRLLDDSFEKGTATLRTLFGVPRLVCSMFHLAVKEFEIVSLDLEC
jgi:hypothetical protein